MPTPGQIAAFASVMLVASAAHAQLRGHTETDTTGFLVVLGLFVLGVGALLLARGRRS